MADDMEIWAEFRDGMKELATFSGNIKKKCRASKELENAALTVESFATSAIPLIEGEHEGCNCDEITVFLTGISSTIDTMKNLTGPETALAKFGSRVTECSRIFTSASDAAQKCMNDGNGYK